MNMSEHELIEAGMADPLSVSSVASCSFPEEVEQEKTERTEAGKHEEAR